MRLYPKFEKTRQPQTNLYITLIHTDKHSEKVQTSVNREGSNKCKLTGKNKKIRFDKDITEIFKNF